MKRKPLTAKRFTQNTILPDGTVTVNPPTDIPFRASIQPADKEQLESYPFLRDYKQVYTLYTSTELYTAQAGARECDTVEIYGKNFDVVTVEAWQNNIRNHYKIMVAR